MAEYRQGRRNGHTVYLQTGEKPNDNDPFVGSCVTPGHAANLVRFANAGLAAEERLEALEEIRQRVSAFNLREDNEGRTLLTYEHSDGEACIVAYLTCPAVLEVAAVLWPTTDEETGDEA